MAFVYAYLKYTSNKPYFIKNYILYKITETIITELYNKGIDFVDGQFNELKDNGELTEKAIDRFEKIINRMGDPKQAQKIKQEIKLVLYNNRPNTNDNL